MSTLTLRLSDDKHQRLRALAEHKKISLNKLFEELSTQALAEFDTEIRFQKLFVVVSFIVCCIFLLLPEDLNREAHSRVGAFEQQRALLETNKKTVSYGQGTCTK